MRILFTVQRYGTEIAGGAEQHCRWLAESLALRGHEVHVLTSCAMDYMTWKDHFEEGTSTINGVEAHRFPVERERRMEFFNQLAEQIDFKEHSSPIAFEDIWLYEQGPALVSIENWLLMFSQNIDVVVPFTYLYSTSQIAVRILSNRKPIVMHATAHDENPIYLRRLKDMLGEVNSFLFSTPEERDLLIRVCEKDLEGEVVGIGVSLESPNEWNELKARLSLPDGPYFVVLGRIDPSKGTDVAARFFSRWRQQSGSNANLLVVGGRSQAYAAMEFDSGIYTTGFVSETDKSTLLHNAVALIQPSPFESFSLALCESWLAGRPSLATAESDVLIGQTTRSNAGYCYEDFDQFSFHLSNLLHNPAVANELGMNGRSFVDENYLPEQVVTKIEGVLHHAIDSFTANHYQTTQTDRG